MKGLVFFVGALALMRRGSASPIAQAGDTPFLGLVTIYVFAPGKSSALFPTRPALTIK
jgi:hypothetical protein